MTAATSDLQAAAAARAQRALSELERLDMTELSRFSLSLGDVDGRAPAREAAVRAVERVGLGPVLGEARRGAHAYVLRTFDVPMFRVIGVDLGESRSRASVDDRVAAVLAAEDAVIAAVAEPFVPDEIRDTLATPLERIRPLGARPGTARPAPALPHMTVTRWSTYVAYGALILASLLLLALGSGIGLFGLATCAAIALVTIVIRGRPLP